MRSASVADWITARRGNTERTLTAAAGSSPRDPYRHALAMRPPRKARSFGFLNYLRHSFAKGSDAELTPHRAPHESYAIFSGANRYYMSFFFRRSKFRVVSLASSRGSQKKSASRVSRVWFRGFFFFFDYFPH